MFTQENNIWKKIVKIHGGTISQDNILTGFFSHFFQTRQKNLSKRGDLGTLFADPSLNENYVEPETGEIKPIFTHKEDKGNIFVRCEICNLQAVGKYNLDTHRGGKKHQANLEKYEMSSKFLRLQIYVHIILT